MTTLPSISQLTREAEAAIVSLDAALVVCARPLDRRSFNRLMASADEMEAMIDDAAARRYVEGRDLTNSVERAA